MNAHISFQSRVGHISLSLRVEILPAPRWDRSVADSRPVFTDRVHLAEKRLLGTNNALN
jgi:hypothetical protein